MRLSRPVDLEGLLMAVSDISPLDHILKPVERAGRQRAGEHYISIREGTDELDPPIWRIGGGKTFTYLVTTDEAGQPPARGESQTIHVNDPKSGDAVSIRIVYQAVCPETGARKLVSSLGSDGDPELTLNKIIKAAAHKELWGKEERLFSDLDSAKMAILQSVANAVTQKTGLKFQCNVRLELEDSLESIQFDERLEVKFNDSPAPRGVRIQADLDVDFQHALRAVVALPKQGALRARVIEAVKDFFRHDVSSQQYAERFRDGSVKQALLGHLETILKEEGRKPSGLSVRALQTHDDLPPSEVQLELVGSVKPLGRDKPISLTSSIRLTLENLALFQEEGIDNVEGWGADTFQAVVRKACFERTYLDFLQEPVWSSIKADIKELMKQEADRIGYCLQQIFSEPELDENKYKDLQSHRFTIRQLPLRSTARARVDLTVDAEFSISEWEDPNIAEKINHSIDLEDDIKREIREALSSILVSISPNNYYLKYADRENGGISVEDQLTNSVKERLESTYKANVSNAIVTQMDTFEVEKVRGLLHRPRELKFTAGSYGIGEEIRFSISWKICGLNSESWDKITSEFANSEEIGEKIASTLKTLFSTLKEEQLRFETGEHAMRLLEAAQRVVKEQIEGDYGVLVQLSNLRRDKTPVEQEIDKQAAAERKNLVESRRKAMEHQGKLGDRDRERELSDSETTNRRRLSDQREIQRIADKPQDQRTDQEEDRLQRLQQKYGGDTVQRTGMSALLRPDLNVPLDKNAILGRGTDVDQTSTSGEPATLPSQTEINADKDAETDGNSGVDNSGT